MSIGTTVRIAGPYIGDGSSQVFPVSFKLFTKQDVYAVKTVIATGVNTVLVLDTDYTVTLNADQNYTPGGTITLTVPLAATEKLTITTAVANLQPIDLNNQGGFYPDVINTGFDRATVQIQQLNDTITRTLRVPVSDGVTANQELPTKELRANRYFYFDGSGNPTVAAGTGGGIASSPVDLVLEANEGGANTGQDIIFKNNGIECGRFVGVNQRLGVNEPSPDAQLHVLKDTGLFNTFTGAVQGHECCKLSQGSVTGAFTSLDFSNVAGAVHARIGSQRNGGGSTLSFGTSNNYANGITNQALQIDPAGTVTAATRFAVGTSTPITIWKGLANQTNSIGIGNNALSATTSGLDNLAIGVNAGNNIVGGSYNTCVGKDSGSGLTSGSSNVLVGPSAGGGSLSTGQFNVCVGSGALVVNAGSSSNTCIGASARGRTDDVSIGYRAGAGVVDAAGTNSNVFLGSAAGENATTASANVCVGHRAGQSFALGVANVAVGKDALQATVGNGTTQGVFNTAVGGYAGQNNTTGASNTFVGYLTGSAAAAAGTNMTCLGNGATPPTTSFNNTITLGNSSIATLRCQVTTISALSDRRDKKDIEDLPSVMPLVDALRPRSFMWNMRDGGKVDLPEFGFIAQELLEAQQQSGITVPNLVNDSDADRFEAAPGTLIPVLLQAIKELKATVESQAARIAALEAAP